MRFHFIEVRRVDYPVRVMCNVLDVSRAGYYAWRPRPESMRSAENRELLDDIQQVHCDNRGGAMAAPVIQAGRSADPAKNPLPSWGAFAGARTCGHSAFDETP